MNEEKKKRNKIIGISIGILVVLLIVVTSTYAYWQITKSQDGSNDIIAACLDIDMESVDGTFGLDPAWPLKDNEAFDLKGYTFKITNNCEEDVNYIIGMDSLEVPEKEYLDYNNIKVSIDDNPAEIYGEQNNIDHIEENDSYSIRVSKKINTAVIEGKVGDKPGENIHNVKVWIKSDAPVEEQSRVFRGRIFITGGQKVDNDDPLAIVEECFEMSGNEIIDYKEDNPKCGESVIIPATVDGVAVKTIDSNAFKGEKIAPVYYGDDIDNTGQTITPVGKVDFSEANIMFIFDNYQENIGLDLALESIIVNAKYIVKLTPDDPVNINIDEAGQEYGISDKIKDSNNIPELSENQIAVYANLATDMEADILGAKCLKNQSNILLIDSLDLSLAYNLEKIEAGAFSNVPSDEYNLENYKNYNESLTYLTFGNNNNSIQLEHNAFANINVDELEVYVSNYVILNTSENTKVTPYASANINKLTIVGDNEHKKWGGGNYSSDYSTVQIFGAVNDSNVGELFLKNVDSYGFGDMNIGTFTIPNILGLADSDIESSATIDKIVLLDGITSVPARAFDNTNVREFVLPESVLSIEGYAFSDSSLSTINLPSKLENIGMYAFSGTDNYTSVTIPSSVVKIGAGAFYAANGTPAKHIIIKRANSSGMELDVMWYNKDNSYLTFKED